MNSITACLPTKGLILIAYYRINLMLLLCMYIIISTTCICPACTYILYSQVSIITIIQNTAILAHLLLLGFA